MVDVLRAALLPARTLGIVSSSLSVFAFGALADHLARLDRCRLVLPSEDADLSFLGSDMDRPTRNGLQLRPLAGRLATWVANKVEVRRAAKTVPQGALVVQERSTHAVWTCPASVDG